MTLNTPPVDGTLYEQIVQRILSVTDPEQIILFGSRARGHHRPDSDIDILVIAESAEPRYMRSRPLHAALSDIGVACDVDVVVYTPAEAQEWGGVPQAFITTALREGRTLYERPRGARLRVGAESGERHDRRGDVHPARRGS